MAPRLKLIFIGPPALVGARLFLHRAAGILHLTQAILLIMPISCSIRGLNHRWEPGRCSFMYHSESHFDHPEHSYKTASFVEELEVPAGSFKGACSLLKSLEEKMCNPEVLLKCRKRTASRVDEHSYPDAQDVPMKDSLLIPKHITDAAATHRFVLAKLFKFKFQGTTQHWLQLGYENIPGQCPCSSTFKPATAELVRERDERYGGRGVLRPPEGSCKRGCTEVDSDGDSPPVRLSAAAALGEYLGPGVSVQVGRGGLSSSHEGMVHAFIRLSESSVGTITILLRSTPSLIQTNGTWLPDLRCSHIHPNFLEWEECKDIVTYRAVVANHRQESWHVSSDRHGSEMAIIPIPGGVVTVGCLTPVYHRRIFGKHTDITIMKSSRQTQSTIHRTINSLRHRARKALGAVRGRWLQCPGRRACRRKDI
jgi:hypothetical protein